MGEVHVHCTLVHVHGGAYMAAVLVVIEVYPQEAYRGTSLIQMLVLHKRRAKYGGDWLMEGVKLRKIYTSESYCSVTPVKSRLFLIFLHQTREKK